MNLDQSIEFDNTATNNDLVFIDRDTIAVI